MKAVIMAGGEGTRLRPLTINRPKPMVPMVDRQALYHIIELLKHHGITEVIITVQYLAHSIQDFYDDGSNFGVHITYSVETSPLGTAGSVKKAEHLLQEPFLVISGDALTDIDLTAAIAHHKRTRADATLVLSRVPTPLEYGVVITGANGAVEKFLEKPSWGEVFSDTVNTGIYILNPDVFRHMEHNRSYDWSRDIFPVMLRANEHVQGYIATGYWTDVGTIEEYRRACSDYLRNQVQLPRSGQHIGGDVWVANDADIATTAQLHGPMYIGHGVRIREGVVVQGPSVIRDYSIIDRDAFIDRSIIWRNSYVGERAELHGALVLRQCDIRGRVMLFEGAVIGDGVQVGSGAVVQPNVKIWPSKEIDEGATVASSLVWGSQARRVLFGRHGIRGLVNVDITPEFCARLGAAYGATLPQGCTVTINRDAHYTPRMLKRAIVAGLPSVGVNVRDLENVPIPVARYFTHASQAAGGVHVRLSPSDGRMVDINFFNERGLNLATTAERKIENTFFREDFRRVYLDEIGRIAYTQNVIETYTEAFLAALDLRMLERLTGISRGSSHHPHLVIDYANANASDVFPAILRQMNLDVVELNANLDEDRIVQSVEQLEAGLRRLSQITPVLEASIGVRIDAGSERIVLVDDRGVRIRGMQALAVMVALVLQANPGGAIAVPITAPRSFDQIAQRYKGQIVRTRTSLSGLMQQSLSHPDLLLLGDGQGGYLFPAFYPMPDGMFATVKLLEMLMRVDTTLSEQLARLPQYFIERATVPCRWESKGKVMRVLNERYEKRSDEQIDGVKLDLGDEWVLIQPDLDGPFFHVIAEGLDADRARLLTDRYAALVSELQQ